ncbi:MAG: DNA-methyltransferase [Treponemataceae bacterium]
MNATLFDVASSEEFTQQKELFVKTGDLFQLGNHLLLCGDSTNQKDVDLVMAGEKADLVFTDPPYGIDCDYARTEVTKKLKIKKIINDNLKDDDLVSFLKNYLQTIQAKKTTSFYICLHWSTQTQFEKAINSIGLKIHSCIIWDKKQFGLNGRKGYRPQYEMIYFCSKEEYIWYGNNGQSNIWQVLREINRLEQGSHPTPKPTELCSIALRNSSKEQDLVFDGFGGSGSTLLACEYLNRRCCMIEIEPYYCQIIIKRWERESGQKAVLIGGGHG